MTTNDHILKWQCLVCGYIHEGTGPPEKCPVCGAPKELFIPAETGARQTQKDLTGNWEGETHDVGLYLAFGKKAEEEGYPEIAQAFFKLALEEGWHAAEIASIRGMVRTTGENLRWQLEAELASHKEKLEAAETAQQQQDTGAAEFFRRTAKDEERHAAIIRGLLSRYFHL
ncbi:MAG: NADH peroxidase [Peptococcaceae bacterium]|nr:MAG: NADH peroxidase [Peptococcaceae bacterium]